MSPRSRILAALNHRLPDRVPIDLSGHRSSGISAIAYTKLRRFLKLPPKPIRVYDPIQQLAVVDVVRRDLLTPFGLRSLSPADSHYKGIYSGPQFQRDQAYHQGTVWAYLIGPFVEAFLKVNSFSPDSRKTAAGFIQPLIDHLTTDGCLGSVSEIFDGDSPHKPKGCFAQAWSVAELIRAYLLIHS